MITKGIKGVSRCSRRSVLAGVLDNYYLTCVPEAVTIEVSSSIAVSVVAVGRLFASLFLFSLT